MAIKSVSETNKDGKTEYPKLMCHRKHEFIVLFTNDRWGIIVNCEKCSKTFPVGYYGDWLISSFKEFYGKVTLSND